MSVPFQTIDACLQAIAQLMQRHGPGIVPQTGAAAAIAAHLPPTMTGKPPSNWSSQEFDGFLDALIAAMPFGGLNTLDVGYRGNGQPMNRTAMVIAFLYGMAMFRPQRGRRCTFCRHRDCLRGKTEIDVCLELQAYHLACNLTAANYAEAAMTKLARYAGSPQAIGIFRQRWVNDARRKSLRRTSIIAQFWRRRRP